MKTNPNDLAFPCINENHSTLEFGLSKREYFIGQALAGLCANPFVLERLTNNTTRIDASVEAMISLSALKCADALIELLKEEK